MDLHFYYYIFPILGYVIQLIGTVALVSIALSLRKNNKNKKDK